MSEPTGKPQRGRPKTLDRAHVANVAMEAYWREGPSEVSLNSICQRAGVSKPSIYREFGNEDGLSRAALETYADAVLARIMEIVASDEAFFPKLEQLAHLVAKDELHESGCLFVKMRAYKSRMGPLTQAAITDVEAAAVRAFADLLRDGRSSGEWTSDISLELAVRYLHAQIGLALDQRARGDDPSETLSLALSVFENGEKRPPSR